MGIPPAASLVSALVIVCWQPAMRGRYMDAPRQLYELLTREGYAAIQRAIDEKWEESTLLDFKAAERDGGPMTTKDRQNLAEAVSGFANSEGGLLIWGVDARPGPDSLDVVQGEKRIAKLRRFVDDLNTYSPQVVSPAVIGVEHVAIPAPEDDDAGFAITLVPKGQDEPHMAVAKEQNRYYYRGNRSFLPMQSFMVADRYRRRPQPKLEFFYRTTHPSPLGREWRLPVYVGIRNVGRGIALYPALAIETETAFSPAMHGLDGNGHSGLRQLPSAPSPLGKRRYIFAGGTDHVVHPGTEFDVTRFELSLPEDTDRSPEFSFRYEAYCDGDSISGEVRIPSTPVRGET